MIAQHGPDAVAFYISGQLLTEDYYVFNKLAKGLIGTNNVDTNSRLCMASAVAGYKQTLGADAPPACYEDIEAAECVFIAGSNTAWAHPVLYQRMEQAAPKHVIVVDPRRTETARAATLHLQIKPGTDVALFNGMLQVIKREGWCDLAYIESHTENFDACWIPKGKGGGDLRRPPRRTWSRRQGCSPLHAPTLPLLPGAQPVLERHGEERGAHQPAPRHRPDRQAGRGAVQPHRPAQRDGRARSRRHGQPASGHRDLGNPEHRAEVAGSGACGASRNGPARPRWRCSRRCRRLNQGVWIACTNPAQSLPDQKLVHEALERAELVVVQDAYRNTETAALRGRAPAGGGWGEKEGTMTNSERRISRVRAAVRAPGEARPDWRIAGTSRGAWGRKALPLRNPGRNFQRAPRDHARPRPGHHRPSPTRCSTSAARSSGRIREARRQA